MTNSDPRLSAANVELKPCPFCGNAQRIREPFGIVRSGYQIACSSDECFGPHTTAHDLEDCIRQWNTRLSGVPAQSVQVPDGYILVPRELTAENGAKGALIGEFNEEFGCLDEDGEEQFANVPVTWTTIKAIHKKMVAHFDASQPPAAPCNAAGNRYPSDEEAEWTINGAHDFAETLRSKAAPVEREPLVCDKCNEVMAAAVGLPISDTRSSAESIEPEELENLIADRSAGRAADAILKEFVVTRRDGAEPQKSAANGVDVEAIRQWFNSLPGESLSQAHWLALLALINVSPQESGKTGGAK